MPEESQQRGPQSTDDLLDSAACLRALGAAVTVMSEQMENSLYGEEISWLGVLISGQALTMKEVLDANSIGIGPILSARCVWDVEEYRALYTRLSQGLLPLDQMQKEIMAAIKRIEGHLRQTKDLLNSFQKLRRKLVSLVPEEEEAGQTTALANQG